MKKTLLLFVLTLPCQAASTFSLSGNSELATWSGLTNANYNSSNGYPTSGSNTPWEPISADSGDQTFSKLSGPAYFITAGTGIYGNFMGSVSSYEIVDSTPLAGLETVVFQARLGQDVSISLNYNGGSQQLAADYFATSTTGGADGLDYAWQWDLSGITDTITDYTISFTAPLHTFIYSSSPLSLHSGDTFTQVIPEPTAPLLGIISLALATFHRRRA